MESEEKYRTIGPHEAMDYLFNATQLIEKVASNVYDGALLIPTHPEQLEEAWYQVNCCRLYTEKDVNLDTWNQSAMGLIMDAKLMIEGSTDEIGLTKHARINILGALAEATAYIITVRDELSHLF